MKVLRVWSSRSAVISRTYPLRLPEASVSGAPIEERTMEVVNGLASSASKRVPRWELLVIAA